MKTEDQHGRCYARYGLKEAPPRLGTPRSRGRSYGTIGARQGGQDHRIATMIYVAKIRVTAPINQSGMVGRILRRMALGKRA
jgi:hypothetical protein